MEKFHNLCVPVLVACAVRDQGGQAVGVEGARLEGGCHKIGGGGQTWILVTPVGGQYLGSASLTHLSLRVALAYVVLPAGCWRFRASIESLFRTLNSFSGMMVIDVLF